MVKHLICGRYGCDNVRADAPVFDAIFRDLCWLNCLARDRRRNRIENQPSWYDQMHQSPIQGTILRWSFL